MPVLEPVFVAVPSSAVEPEPVVALETDLPKEVDSGAAEEAIFSGFMFLEPPPDE